MTYDELQHMNAQQLASLQTKLEIFHAQTRTEIENILRVNKEIEKSVHELKSEVHLLINLQKEYEVALDTLNTVVKGSTVLKWIVISVVGLFSAVSVIAAAIEVMRGWAK